MKTQLPSLLAYPDIPTLDEIPEIAGQFVYVVKNYATKGLDVLIFRDNEEVFIRFGNFSGTVINHTDKTKIAKMAMEFMEKYSSKFVTFMSSAKIKQAIYYIVRDKKTLRLIDMRTSLNKFAGPGMLRDLYSAIIDTQEVIKTITMTDDTLKAAKNGTGSFKNAILKTSTFKTATRGSKPNLIMVPMYARTKT